MGEEKEKEKKGGKAKAQEEEKPEAVNEDTPENEGGEGEGEEDKDDKKGKKKKGKKEEEAKKKKKPNKAILAAMAETLAKQKEEEDRLKAEEDEKERLENQRVADAIEAKRKEEERRALKKEREKQKKEQLKAEGKWLTPAQKAAKARADAALEAMRAQGAEVPVVGEKKLTMKERAKLKKQNKSKHAEQAASKETTPVEAVEEKVEEVKVEKEEVKEAEKVAEEEEDVLDNWMDADDSDKEEEAKKKQADEKEKAATEAKQAGGEESEDDDDEDESESEEESSSEEEDDLEEGADGKTLAEIKRERAIARIKDRMKTHAEAKSKDNLRSPVVCVLGHVDTGKTKILDKLRRTSVQDGEAGGITQQIGATNVPIAVIKEQCKMVHGFNESPLKLPGLLIIDTPGHESFSNLRDRGSSLCDIAILVIDIMHSLEPQTIESINLLKKKKTPFVVALNKIDRLYEWKPNRHKDVREVLEMQSINTKLEFTKRKDEVILGLAEQGINAALFYENPDLTDYISLVPTSAHSGDGMGNLMGQLVQMSQTMLEERLSFSEELQATVLEVKAIGGFGTTIDVVLVNGRLKFGQTIV